MQDEFTDEREGVSVAYCPLVQLSVVLNRSKLSVFLFNEEERGSVWAF